MFDLIYETNVYKYTFVSAVIACGFFIGFSIVGKFVIIFITWSFSFQILSEVRHFFWDLGYGFELKTSNLTGVFVIVGSFLTTLLIYFLGRVFI